MIIVDYKDTRPLYEQIADKFELLILKGALEPDSKMPSVRNLAMELSINPNTIQKSYERLERNGFIYTIKGRGNFVSPIEDLIEQRRANIKCQLIVLKKEALEIGLTTAELITCLQEGELS